MIVPAASSRIWFPEIAKTLKRLAQPASRRRNVVGDRQIEWSWVSARMPAGPGAALDFGCGGSSLGLGAAIRGFDVTSIDLGPVAWPYRHERQRFLRGDVLALDLPRAHFDLVINCSTVEHVGLPGRYGIREDQPDGDLRAMARLAELMKPGATMLLTVPAGCDAVFAPKCRVYGRDRLPRLVGGFRLHEEAYWQKDAENRWVEVARDAALDEAPFIHARNGKYSLYAIGCFLLKRE